MELKFTPTDSGSLIMRSNRTFMELKFINSATADSQIQVLIAPLWN